MKTKTIAIKSFLRALIIGIILFSFSGMINTQAQDTPKPDVKPASPVSQALTKDQIKQEKEASDLKREQLKSRQSNARKKRRLLSLIPRRYYYDFFTKKLFFTPDSRSEEIFRPISYRANRDIQIAIFNYNPLKDQIIIENNFSVRFLADTGVFAKFVVLPKVSDIKSPVSDSSMKKVPPGWGVKEAFMKRPAKDCESFHAYLIKFDVIKAKCNENISNYKDFLSKIELIQDDYNYFKQQDTLSGPEIISKLDGSFLIKLNEDPSSKLASSIVNVSSRELSELESTYYSAITDTEKDLDNLKKKVSLLTTDNCEEYVKLNNKFNDAYAELKGKITELKNNRSEKILPSFNKTLLLYDMLKKYSKGVTDFITPALTIDKDLHTINIYKKELGSNDKVLHDNINIEPIRGWKIDFASGVFITGLYDAKFTKKSKDSIYTTKYVSNGVIRDTTINKPFSSIYKTDQIPVSFGGMIFLHAHTQNSRMFNYGCYLGFGALFNDQTRWTMSLGGSLIIGKKQRFNINIGAVIAQVERLQQPYETEKWYTDVLDNIPTTKVWKLSYLLGFSWNIK